MKAEIIEIEDGSVTVPEGFEAGAVEAEVKYKGRLDLGLIYSQKPCRSAAVFTSNKVKAAPVLVSMKNNQNGNARAFIANSGCANACTGERGIQAAYSMAQITASKLGILDNQVIVASTGVIGTDLPIERIGKGLYKLELSRDGGHKFARAIMTTDTRPKEIALRVTDNTGTYVIAGVAKGAGMIHPDMATLLVFLTTDAVVELDFLRKSLKNAVKDSFNMITVDGDTSTNDMAAILANGAAGNIEINAHNGRAFAWGVSRVCAYLAQCVAADGEGATKMIEVYIEGARNKSEARRLARTIAGSNLVKSAMHGNDPNWGRIAAAAGRSGCYLDESKLEVILQGNTLMKDGLPLTFDKASLSNQIKRDSVKILVNMHVGKGRATAWGCDLSEEYVTINSDYTT